MAIKRLDHPTRLRIIRTGVQLYLEQGFTKTTNQTICKACKISPGQFTNFFPTKEHLLAELVRELCDFQQKKLEQQVEEGRTSLLAVCLELAVMASICQENITARDFYISAYTHPMTLELIRANDGERASHVFGEFCPDWTEEHFRRTENLVSGIEYAALMTTECEHLPVETVVEDSLTAIMNLYQVPARLQQEKLKKLRAMDCRVIGRRVFAEFAEYIYRINEQALENALQL